MQAIADKARVNKALIHYYFRNKDGLYEAVLKGIVGHVWEELESNFAQLENQADVRTVVRTLVSTYIRTLKSSPGFPQLFLRELADGGEIIPRIVQGFVERFGETAYRIVASLKAGVQRGALRPIDPAHIIMNVMGMCAASFILKPVFQSVHESVLRMELEYDEKFYAARITAITEMTLEGILAKGSQ